MDKDDIKINWNKMVSSYEGFTNSPNSYSNRIEWPAIKRILPDLKNKNIIDLGCGTGRFTFLFEQFMPERIIGIDISDEMIKMAEGIAFEKNSSVHLIKSDIENLSIIQPNSIDFVFSSTAMHYLKSLEKIMKEIYRVLKPKGICILSVIHPIYSAQYPVVNENRDQWDVKYLDKSIRAYVQPWIEHDAEIENFLSHSYHHTMSDYMNSIIEAGLSIKALVEPLPPEDWRMKWPEKYRGYINNPTYAIFKIEK